MLVWLRTYTRTVMGNSRFDSSADGMFKSAKHVIHIYLPTIFNTYNVHSNRKPCHFQRILDGWWWPSLAMGLAVTGQGHGNRRYQSDKEN